MLASGPVLTRAALRVREIGVCLAIDARARRCPTETTESALLALAPRRRGDCLSLYRRPPSSDDERLSASALTTGRVKDYPPKSDLRQQSAIPVPENRL
jgi:hypothetical protein